MGPWVATKYSIIQIPFLVEADFFVRWIATEARFPWAARADSRLPWLAPSIWRHEK